MAENRLWFGTDNGFQTAAGWSVSFNTCTCSSSTHQINSLALRRSGRRFYTSAFRHRRHILGCLSVRPIVWPPNPPLERFLSILLRTHGNNGLKFGVLMYPDHHQNWLDFGPGLYIFFLKCQHLDLSKRFYLGFPGISCKKFGSKCWKGSRGVFPTLCVAFCLLLNIDLNVFH